MTTNKENFGTDSDPLKGREQSMNPSDKVGDNNLLDSYTVAQQKHKKERKGSLTRSSYNRMKDNPQAYIARQTYGGVA